MFRQLNENRDRPKGKQANEQTIKAISTQYELGRPEWQPPLVSQTKADFLVRFGMLMKCLKQGHEAKYERVKNEKCFKAQIVLGTDPVDYTSSIQGTYLPHPEE